MEICGRTVSDLCYAECPLFLFDKLAEQYDAAQADATSAMAAGMSPEVTQLVIEHVASVQATLVRGMQHVPAEGGGPWRLDYEDVPNTSNFPQTECCTINGLIIIRRGEENIHVRRT